MKILYLSPRLDVPFKNFGPVSNIKGPISSLRQNWVKFQDGLIQYCNLKRYFLNIEEKPLWQFNELDYIDTNYDLIIVPHKEFHNFKVEGKKCLYLMQAPFPEYFSLDINGWAGNLSYLDNLSDIMIRYDSMKMVWDNLRSRVLSNISKFQQPLKGIDQEDFVLFICQLPHDETIKYHSNISVEDALSKTIEYSLILSKQLVVKGHPANPQSMENLKIMTNNSKNIWVDDVSIHSCIKKSSHCVTVNSGAGLEVIMHKKPIFTFGNSEYDSVAYKSSLFDYLSNDIDVDEDLYQKFIYRYISELIDPHDLNTYRNSFERILGTL